MTLFLLGLASSLNRFEVVLLQAMPLLCPDALWCLSTFSPEPLLFITSAIVAILAYRVTFHRGLGAAVHLGAALVFGAVTKIVFFPLLAVVCAVRPRRVQAATISAFILGVAVLLAPVWSRLKYICAWIGGLISHSGSYGQGPENFVDLKVLPTRLFAIFVARYSIFATVGALLLRL